MPSTVQEHARPRPTIYVKQYNSRLARTEADGKRSYRLFDGMRVVFHGGDVLMAFKAAVTTDGPPLDHFFRNGAGHALEVMDRYGEIVRSYTFTFQRVVPFGVNQIDAATDVHAVEAVGLVGYAVSAVFGRAGSSEPNVQEAAKTGRTSSAAPNFPANYGPNGPLQRVPTPDLWTRIEAGLTPGAGVRDRSDAREAVDTLRERFRKTPPGTRAGEHTQGLLDAAQAIWNMTEFYQRNTEVLAALDDVRSAILRLASAEDPHAPKPKSPDPVAETNSGRGWFVVQIAHDESYDVSIPFLYSTNYGSTVERAYVKDGKVCEEAIGLVFATRTAAEARVTKVRSIYREVSGAWEVVPVPQLPNAG